MILLHRLPVAAPMRAHPRLPLAIDIVHALVRALVVE